MYGETKHNYRQQTGLKYFCNAPELHSGREIDSKDMAEGAAEVGLMTSVEEGVVIELGYE